ncbi:MAG: DUF2807 domain-containing protein [Bacteroidota bacterium]
MKKTLTHIFSLLIFAVAGFFAACSDSDFGDITIKEDNELPVFTKVDVRAHGDYELKVGAGHSIRIETHVDIIDRFLYEVVDGELFIRFDSPRGNVNIEKLEITIGIENLEKITLNEVADIEVSGKIETATLAVFQNDVGNIEIEEVALQNLLIDLDDVGNVSIDRGVVTNGNLQLNGVGDIRTFGVTYQNCKAVLNDVGNIEVTVAGALEATINGVGNIYYKGNPDISKQERGTGSVIQR